MKRHNYNIAIAIAISCILFLINGYHNYIKDQRKENLEKYKAGYYDNVTVKNKNIVPNTTKNYVPPKNWTKYIIANAFSISVPPTVELRQSNDLYTKDIKKLSWHGHKINSNNVVFQQKGLSVNTPEAHQTYCRIIIDIQKGSLGEYPKFSDYEDLTIEDIHTFQELAKQMTKEQAKAGRLSFDDEGNQMVKGAGMKPGGTAGKYIATQAVISGMKAVTSEEEETDENAGVESARLAERETEAALRGLRHAQIRSKRTDVKTHRRGYREATVEKKLKFGSAESMEGVKNAETVKKAEQKRHFYNRFFQKKRYKDAYRVARAGKSAGSLGGATTIAGVENMTVKAKIALKEIIKRNRAMFAGIGIFALLFLVIAVSLGSCSASIEGAGSVIGITTYPSSDEDIYAAENQYAALESALNQQINEMEMQPRS